MRESPGIPTIGEKTAIPRPSNTYLARSRLDRIWGSWKGRKVVLVIAGAGFGKTSFLAANARTSRPSPAWLTLDEMDRDLATLVAHMRAAVCLDPRTRWPAQATNDPSLARGFLAELTHALHAQQGRILVLDDIHCLRGASASEQFLADLARYVPEGTTLILSGREPIEIPTLRGRVQGRIEGLSTQDLAFRPQEAAALFERRFPGTALSGSLARRLVAQTEGWAAGIEICFQLLDGTSPEAIRRTLDRLGSTGIGWFDYFAEEIVAHLDPGMQEFLEKVSVLPRMDGDICDRLLGIQNSRRRLDALFRRNLFIVAENEEAAAYRIHALFRQFLRNRLGERLAGGALRAHLRRASRLLIERHAFADAAEVLAEAGDLEASVRLIERRGEGLLAEGRYETVLRAFRRLPEPLLADRPRALFVRARLHDFQSEWDQAERLYQRILRRRPGAARKADLAGLIAQIQSRRGEYAAAYASCRRALRAAAAPGASTRIDHRIRGRILATMGVCASELGRLEEGERLLGEAGGLYRRHGDDRGEGRIDYLLAINVYLPRGEMGRARTAARRALVRFRRLRDPRRICYSLGVLAFVSAEAGDYQEGRELAEETLRIAENIGQREHEGIAHHILGRCAQATGDLDGACARFAMAADVGEELGHRVLGILPRIGLAEVQLARGDAAAGRAAALDALARARAAGDRVQEAQCCIVLGQLGAAGAGTARGRRWWRQAESILRRSGALFDLRRLQLLRLDVERIGAPAGRAMLRELLDGNGTVDREALFLRIEPDRACRVLPRAIEAGVEVDRAASLLASIGERAVPGVAALLESTNERSRSVAVEILTRIGSAPARQILRDVARRHSRSSLGVRAAEEVARIPERPLHVQALGRFRVRLGEEEIAASSWRSGRALRLFQLLVLHRFRWVPKEQVIEALWGEAVEPEKATISLWQAVHQLRRILEPERAGSRESCYVRFQNEAYRLERGDGGSYDVLDFEQALQEGESLMAQGKAIASERSLRRALDLYAGDFFTEHPYEDFLAGEREKLRDALIRGLLVLLDSLAGRGRWAACLPLSRRGLEQDPLHEELHYHLLQAQFRLRHRREALESYHRYEELMVRELGLPPSQRLRALADKIVSI